MCVCVCVCVCLCVCVCFRSKYYEVVMCREVCCDTCPAISKKLVAQKMFLFDNRFT